MQDRTQWDVFLIRHGSTQGNAEKRYIGKTDEGLSEQGKAQLTGKKMPAVDCLFSSPMKRCLETCAVLFPHWPILELAEFREIDFGEFEGKNYQELQGDPRYQAWIDSGGRMTFPGGESREAFIARSVMGFREMMRRAEKMTAEELHKPEKKTDQDCGRRVAAVVHGGTVMAILSELCGGDYYAYQIANGEGYHLLVEVSEDGMLIRRAEKM